MFLRGVTDGKVEPDEDGYYYHVTYYGRLSSIAQHGLQPGYAPAIGTAIYDTHRKGRVFLTTLRGVFHWFDRAEVWAQEHSENPLEDGFTPVVLSIDPKGLKSEPQSDDVANHETIHAHALFVESIIKPRHITVWDGEDWIEVKHWNDLVPERSYKHEVQEADSEDEDPVEWDVLLEWRDNPLFPPEAEP